MEKIILDKLKSSTPKEGIYIALSSSIAGYHVFNVRPIPGLVFPMTLHREKNNAVHNNAIIVKKSAKSKLSENVIKLANGRDVFDKDVGHVPREISDIKIYFKIYHHFRH